MAQAAYQESQPGYTAAKKSVYILPSFWQGGVYGKQSELGDTRNNVLQTYGRHWL